MADPGEQPGLLLKQVEQILVMLAIPIRVAGVDPLQGHLTLKDAQLSRPVHHAVPPLPQHLTDQVLIVEQAVDL